MRSAIRMPNCYVLAKQNFLNCLGIKAKQEFRELSARLLLPHLRQGARFGAQGESDKHALYAVQTIRALSKQRGILNETDSQRCPYLWDWRVRSLAECNRRDEQFQATKLSGSRDEQFTGPVRKN